jgi:hypothetical protein
MGRYFCRSGWGGRRSRPPDDRQFLNQGPSLREGRKRGALASAIGRSKGGPNTKIHAVTDGKGRPCVIVLTPGNVHDCKVARLCLDAMPPSAELLADKGYDSKDLMGLAGAARHASRHPVTLEPPDAFMRTIKPSTGNATSSNACSAD